VTPNIFTLNKLIFTPWPDKTVLDLIYRKIFNYPGKMKTDVANPATSIIDIGFY
jgi:hypothetical protein